MKITPGCRIVGKSGKYYTVDKIEGDILHCGELKISTVAVLQVLPPAFKVGDRVHIPNCDRYGKVNSIREKVDRGGLWAQVEMEPQNKLSARLFPDARKERDFPIDVVEMA
jgi:hypothetical protein